MPLMGGLAAGSGLLSLFGGKHAAKAAKEAAKIQSASADKALAAQKAGYQQQRQDFMPYQQAGTAAMARLGQSAGQYVGGMPSQPPPNAQMPPPGQMGQLGQPQGMGPQASNNIVWGGRQQPPQMGAPQGPPPQGGGGMVRVQAPSGEVAMMNPQQVQAAVAKGAKVLA